MQTSLLLDRADKRIIAVTTQDVEPILERNKALQAEPQPAPTGAGISAPSPTSSWSSG